MLPHILSEPHKSHILIQTQRSITKRTSDLRLSANQGNVYVCFILLLAPLWINTEIKGKTNTTNYWEGLDKTTCFREIISQGTGKSYHINSRKTGVFSSFCEQTHWGHSSSASCAAIQLWTTSRFTWPGESESSGTSVYFEVRRPVTAR